MIIKNTILPSEDDCWLSKIIAVLNNINTRNTDARIDRPKYFQRLDAHKTSIELVIINTPYKIPLIA